jgi:hypothetical protein
LAPIVMGEVNEARFVFADEGQLDRSVERLDQARCLAVRRINATVP